MSERIPFADLGSLTRQVRGEVDRAWAEILDEGWFVRGPQVGQFEEQWARFCGTDYALGVANGTDALTLTLRAMGVGRHDDVVVPANTFVATVEAVVLVGARPRFADVDPDTLLMTADTFRAAWTPRTKVVIPVHLFGQPVPMDALCDAAEQRGVAVVEDAAQAHGATWRGRRVGSFGIAACFSFYPGKNLGAFGDGGAVVTSHAGIAAGIAGLRDHGRADGSRYDHTALGTNSRLDTVQAAVLSAKLPHLDEWNARRRDVADAYQRQLAGSLVRWVPSRPEAEHVHHLAVVRVPARTWVQSTLAEAGVESGIHYPVPCHRMAPYAAYAGVPLPEVERAAEEILSLPMFPGMTVEQVTRVCDLLVDATERASELARVG
jgi:dTDP-4-amino-4,6-dideoxygalactose transaminase